jgi:hypothetical protein
MGIQGGRERYYRALYDRLAANTPSVKWRGRSMAAYANLPAEQQPALVFNVAGQTPEQQPRMPPKWLLGTVLVLMARDTNAAPGEVVLNAMIDEVEYALEWQPGEPVPGNGELWHTTLGGIVQRCYIDGVIEFPSAGEASEQAMALVPVVMEVVGTGRRVSERPTGVGVAVDDVT